MDRETADIRTEDVVEDIQYLFVEDNSQEYSSILPPQSKDYDESLICNLSPVEKSLPTMEGIGQASSDL